MASLLAVAVGWGFLVWLVSGSAMPMNLGNLADSSVGTREERQETTRCRGYRRPSANPAETLVLVLVLDVSGTC